MIPVFYINLATRDDRREFMERQFAELGIAAERVDAVTLAEVPPELVAEHQQPQHMWRLGPADLACGLSHQRIWRLMAQRGVSEALILEDDALLSPDVVAFLAPGLLGRLEADLVKLETYRRRILLGTRRQRVGNIALRELGSSHMGSAAYLISGEAARLSLEHPAVNDMGIDRFLFGRGGPHLLRSRILQADPSPAVQLVLEDPKKHGWEVWYEAKGTAYSDIATTRDPMAFRGKAKTPRKFEEALALQVRHTTNIGRLLLRDPLVVGRRRRRIAFVSD